MAVYQIFTYLGLKVHLRPIYSGRESRVLNKGARRFPGGGKPVAIGKELKPIQTRTDIVYFEEVDSHKELAHELPSNVRTSIIWLNTARHEEIALAYIAYGNEAEIGTEYSSLALLIPIPPFSYLTNTRMPASLWRDRSNSPSRARSPCEDDSQLSDDFSDEELQWFEDPDELATFAGRNYTPPGAAPLGSTLVTATVVDRSRSMQEGGSTWMPAVVASAVAGGEQRGMFVDLTEGEAGDDTEVNMDSVGDEKREGGIGMEDESQGGWGIGSLSQVE